MGFEEKRRHPRIKTIHVVGYALFDENGSKLGIGKGRTLDLSQGGTLLETESKLQGTFVVLMTIDLEGKKIKVQGRVIRSNLDPGTGMYLTGIEFIGPKEKQTEAIVAFVKAYQHSLHQSG